MNKNLLISVIMSVFNGGKHLNEAIESILNQSFSNYEFIIVDDASDLKTKNILKKYQKKDKRIIVVTNPSNIGLTKSLNKGIKVAKGKYIARMDEDDISLETRLVKQIEFLESNPKYALVGTRAYKIDELGKIIGAFEHPVTYKNIIKKITFFNPFVHGSVMFRKDVFKCMGGYDEDYLFSQDYELWSRFCLFFKCENLKEKLFLWRKSEGNITSSKYKIQKIYADAVKGKYLAFFEILKCNESLKHKNIKNISLFLKDYKYYTENFIKYIYNLYLNYNINSRDKLQFIKILQNEGSGFVKDNDFIFLLQNIKKKNKFEKYHLASLFQKNQQMKIAEKIFRQLLSDKDENFTAGVKFHLAEINFIKKNFKKAQVLLNQVLIQIPAHQKAKELLNSL